MAEWKGRPWLVTWCVISIFILLFPHSTDSQEGVHFHDEIIVEDWIEIHEQGHLVIPAHQTAGQVIDSIPLIVAQEHALVQFSFSQIPSSHTFTLTFDNRICVSLYDGQNIENGSMTMAPLEYPEVALEGWIDEDGCVNFVAREQQNQLLTFDLECPETIPPQLCRGRFIIPDNAGKVWDLNIHGELKSFEFERTVEVQVTDASTTSPLVGVELHANDTLIASTDEGGKFNVQSKDIVNQSLTLSTIQSGIDEVIIDIDGLRWQVNVSSNSADLPLLFSHTISIQTLDAYDWAWKHVAISFVSDEEYGAIVTPLGISDTKGSLTWAGLVPEGAHQILGITSNVSLPMPTAPAFGTSSGEPTYLNRFSIGNSLYLTLFVKIGLIELAGIFSLGLLALSCWHFSRQMALSIPSQWTGAFLLNLSGTTIIITHADMMSDLHSAALMMLSISLMHGFFAEKKYESSFDQWGNLLLASLLLGLALSIRFLNLLYLPIILLIPFIYSKNLSSSEVKQHRKAYGLLIISIILAVIPILAYHEAYHGHILNYNASDDESPPSPDFSYDWTALSSNPVENHQTSTSEISTLSNEQTVFTQSDSTDSEWIPFAIHERSYTAQILTILMVSLIYVPAVLLAVISYFRVLKFDDDSTLGLRSTETWLLMFILMGIIGLMIERSPFFVSHWSDDNRYFTPLLAPSALLCAKLLPQQSHAEFWKNRRFQMLCGGLTLTAMMVAIPRLLWQGTRKPMSVSRGLHKEGRFDLTHFYENTGTPHWILDAQFSWHPFSERLTYATYEVVSLLLSCLTIALVMWKWRTKLGIDEEE
ncbi:MAG TPA: hypothetical protein EYG33_01625 [Candidatus Poseidoniales archaeon]|jgi:hypothetical protein|nr:hypothetical protein [Candidatus Poseidoniales archaeon]